MASLNAILKRAKASALGQWGKTTAAIGRGADAVSDALVIDTKGKKATLGDIPKDIRKVKKALSK
jgi:hypothetical protein